MEKSRIKNPRFIIALLPIVILLMLFIWFIMSIFEGEKPQAQLTPLPEYLSKRVAFDLAATDHKRGLRTLKVSIKQDGPVIPVFEKSFAYTGLLNRRGIHTFEHEFAVDPIRLNLVQGQANLVIEVRDFSKRSGGDGNLTIIDHKMVVDTIPPSITPLSRSHNITIGGSALIIYRISTDTLESGVFVNDLFFPGLPYLNDPQTGIHICYFAFPHNFKKDTPLHLWAKDRAENETEKSFIYHIRQKRFREDTIRISDRLLDTLISSFSPQVFEAGMSKIEKYLFLNRELRKENHLFLKELCHSSTRDRLWDGPWLRMKNSATMANFGDRRIYYYKGKLIDEGVHLGVDLASLARSPILASNSGRIILAQDLGIYGLTVVIDHGQGIYTMYGHLSSIEATVGQFVTKGETIGASGATGLASGDHLHFGFLIHGVPVNPIEWWDSHWIGDNIDRKFAMIGELAEK
jgi:hypothetical protein